MKNLLAIALMLTGAYSQSTPAMETVTDPNSNIPFSSAIGLVPSMSTGCVFSPSRAEEGCQLAIGWGSLTISTTSLTAVALLKEDIAAVKPDAYNFLAGEEISLALEDQMERVRQEIPEAQKMTDKELALFMLQITEMQ